MHSTLNPPLQLQETPNVDGGRAVLEAVWKKIYLYSQNELKLGKNFQFQMGVWVVPRLIQRLKSTFFEHFSSPRAGPLRTHTLHLKNSQKNPLILAFDANSVIFC